jgi:hypothetical protein
MNRTGCIVGLLAGFGSFVAQYLAYGTRSVGGFDPFVWSLLISLLGCVAAAYLGERPTQEIHERYFGESPSH